MLGGTSVINAFQGADVVLAVGCKFSNWIPCNRPPKYPVPAGQKIIQIDIDYAAMGVNAPADIGVIGDARESVKLLVDGLEGRSLAHDEDWLAGLIADRQNFQSELEAVADAMFVDDGGILNEAAVCREIAGLLPEDAIVAIDGGQSMQWAHAFYQPIHPSKLIYNPGMGHLGSGLPFANAAKLSNPGKTVVAIVGDGAMGCTVQELETAARNGLNTIVFVLNDSFWGMYKPFGDILLNNQNLGTNLTDVDFSTLARGFGCQGERVDTLEDLKEAYSRAAKSGKPTVIDVKVGFTPFPMDAYWLEVVLAGMRFPGLE